MTAVKIFPEWTDTLPISFHHIIQQSIKEKYDETYKETFRDIFNSLYLPPFKNNMFCYSGKAAYVKLHIIIDFHPIMLC